MSYAHKNITQERFSMKFCILSRKHSCKKVGKFEKILINSGEFLTTWNGLNHSTFPTALLLSEVQQFKQNNK